MTKMNRTMRRIVVFAMVLAASAIGVQGAAALGCAPYVSGWDDGAPFGGDLIGTSTVTLTFGGDGLGLTATVSQTFEVGTYRAPSGKVLTLRCDIYTLFLI